MFERVLKKNEDFSFLNNTLNLSTPIARHTVPRSLFEVLDIGKPIFMKMAAKEVNASTVDTSADFTFTPSYGICDVDCDSSDSAVLAKAYARLAVAYDDTNGTIHTLKSLSSGVFTFNLDAGGGSCAAGHLHVFYRGVTGKYRVQYAKAGGVEERNIRVMEGSVASLNRIQGFNKNELLKFQSAYQMPSSSKLEIYVDSPVSMYFQYLVSGADILENITELDIPVMKLDEKELMARG